MVLLLVNYLNLKLLRRLEDWIKKYHPISVDQIGFREGIKLQIMYLYLTTFINKILKMEKKELSVDLIDFCKAYLRNIPISFLFVIHHVSPEHLTLSMHSFI